MVKYVYKGYTWKEKICEGLIKCFVYVLLFSDFLYKSICCWYPFELHQLVIAVQMSTHNKCLYKEVDKKYSGCYLKTTEVLDCALIGLCAVGRSNKVHVVLCF